MTWKSWREQTRKKEEERERERLGDPVYRGKNGYRDEWMNEWMN